MNKYFTLFIILLSSLQCLSRQVDFIYADLLAKEDSLIGLNDSEGMMLLCDEIINIDSLNRNHPKEVEMLKLAIDYINAEMVALFYMRKIGLYDERVDSITPIEYFLDDNFINRVKRLNIKEDSKNAMQNFYFTTYVLLGFQPINDRIFELVQMRLKELSGIIDEEK